VTPEDRARLAEDHRVLAAAEPPADSVTYVETETGFAIAQGQPTDAAAAADPAIAQRHRNVLERLRDLVETLGDRLDNQRAWRGLARAARRALTAADRPTADLPGALVDLYDNIVSLASFVGQDDRIGADPGANDPPMEPDIRRALLDSLAIAAPWLRGFPSVLAWDGDRRDFLARLELFEPIHQALPAARRFLEAAGETGTLPLEDVVRAALPLDTAERGGVQGEKAGYRGHGNALGLATRCAAAVVAFYLYGAVASDFATKSVLVQRAGTLLAQAEAAALQLAARAPDDLRIALEHVLAQNRQHQEGGAGPPKPVPSSPPDPSPWPPRIPFARWQEPLHDLPEASWPDMITLPAGTFRMGAPKGERAINAHERPQRLVTVTRPFALGRTAVTFAMWDAAVAAGFAAPEGAERPDDIMGWGRGARPVIHVCWHDAQAYCAWLNEQLGLRPGTYRLPSEAEWEYACRAGTDTPFNFGEGISTTQANGVPAGGKRGRRGTVPVGSLPANDWGLHEMHGNVWEWVEDAYGPYPDCPTDAAPLQPEGSSSRVIRGGSWDGTPRHLRSAARGRFAPGNRIDDIGFRLARTLGV
jgi:formylglycine-generating enzyme required for sulfatase activity